jgi:hypothetical protein
VLGEAHQIGEQNAHDLEAVGDDGFILVQAATAGASETTTTLAGD